MDFQIAIASLGLILAAYAVYVEYKSRKGPYKALCDINDSMSCSKAFTSTYGSTLGLQNGVWGLLFYMLVIAMTLAGMSRGVLYLAILSVLGSGYLAYVLFAKLKDFCIVCTAIYLVNIALLVASILST